MTASVSSERIRGAVLLVNNTLRTHSPEDAKQLHHKSWREYINKQGKHLDFNAIAADPNRSILVLDAVERALKAIPSPYSEAVRLRFGINDGQQRSLEQVGKQVYHGREVGIQRAGQMTANGEYLLRHSLIVASFEVFFGEGQ